MNIPVSAIREQIASAIHLIVQLTRFPCGSRKVTQISEVAGFSNGVIQMQDVFLFKKTGVDDNYRTTGRYESAGMVPNFIGSLQEHGVRIDLERLFGEAHA